MVSFPKKLTALALAAAALSGCNKATQQQTQADLVLINGDIYSVDSQTPRAQAFAVKDHKFIALGSNDELQKWVGEKTQVIDAQGKTVVPGFVDNHTHIILGMNLATGVDLSDIAEQQEWLRLIKAKADSLKPGEWILGGAWNHLLVANGQLPTKEMLDAITPKNPVLLWDIDHHSGWVNSKALEIAGISKDTHVDGGEVLLNDKGEPSGILLEAAAYIVEDTPGVQAALDPKIGLQATQKLANAAGVTSIHDFSPHDETFVEAVENNTLTLRVWKSDFLEGDALKDTDSFINDFIKRGQRYQQRIEAHEQQKQQRGPLFKLNDIKMYSDGVLSTRTALLKDPYSDQADAQPVAMNNVETLSKVAQQANKANISVTIHAIGDLGVSNAIDAIESASDYVTDIPNRLEHIEMITDADIARMEALNIGASMQPIHATCCTGDYIIDRIGEQRTKDLAYRWGSLLKAGVNLAFGSDWPTSPFSPLPHLEAAQTRTSKYHDGVFRQWDGGVNALSFEQALYAYTQGSANLTAWKDQIGSISPGKWADFVILDKTLAKQGIRSLSDVSVESTWLAGEAIYRK